MGINTLNTSAIVSSQYDLDGTEVYDSNGETVADLEKMEQEELNIILKEYLSKFKDEEKFSLVVADKKERLHLTLKETIFLEENPVILANVDGCKSFYNEEREINE